MRANMQAIPLSLNRTWLTKAAPHPHPTPKTNNIKKKNVALVLTAGKDYLLAWLAYLLPWTKLTLA